MDDGISRKRRTTTAAKTPNTSEAKRARVAKRRYGNCHNSSNQPSSPSDIDEDSLDNESIDKRHEQLAEDLKNLKAAKAVFERDRNEKAAAQHSAATKRDKARHACRKSRVNTKKIDVADLKIAQIQTRLRNLQLVKENRRLREQTLLMRKQLECCQQQQQHRRQDLLQEQLGCQDQPGDQSTHLSRGLQQQQQQQIVDEEKLSPMLADAPVSKLCGDGNVGLIVSSDYVSPQRQVLLRLAERLRDEVALSYAKYYDNRDQVKFIESLEFDNKFEPIRQKSITEQKSILADQKAMLWADLCVAKRKLKENERDLEIEGLRDEVLALRRTLANKNKLIHLLESRVQQQQQQQQHPLPGAFDLFDLGMGGEDPIAGFHFLCDSHTE